MSNKKKSMSCLPLVGVFILVGMCSIVVLYNLTQQNDSVKPSAPEPNWQVKTIRKTPENIRLEKPVLPNHNLVKRLLQILKNRLKR